MVGLLPSTEVTPCFDAEFHQVDFPGFHPHFEPRVKPGTVHDPPRVAVFVGPRSSGSNMAALAAACRCGQVDATICRVVGPKPDAPAMGRAVALGLAVAMIDPEGPEYAARILALAREDGWDVVCLAGFLRKIPPEVIAELPGRILNIHPALLPKFGGRGMYGRRVHEAVLAAGESESGCTVHLVGEEYDDGPIVVQLACPVEPGDTPESLATRVSELEHRAYPLALGMVIQRERHS